MDDISQWLTQPHIHHVLVVTSTVLKHLVCEADHSSLSSAKLRIHAAVLPLLMA